MFPAPGGFFYQAVMTEDGIEHHELWNDEQGMVSIDNSRQISVAIGSGKRGRTFLWSSSERLFQSPITWYSGDARWDLAPGYSLQNQHFERQISVECLNCHVGRIHALDQHNDRFGSPPFLECGVSCENCHGPAQEHVGLFKNAGSTDVGKAAGSDLKIVNPARLPARQREAVCYQCHLSNGHRVLRHGRNHLDYRPGDSLEDIWTIFVTGTGVNSAGSTDAVSHVQQMQSSRCFTASNGKFGCTTCHDPHQVPSRDGLEEFYRSRCLQCHGDPRSVCKASDVERSKQQNSCVACHMKSLSASNVPHTSQTDHRILRRPSTGQPGAKDPEPELRVFDGADERIPALELQRARGILMSRFAQNEKDKLLANAAAETLRPLQDRFQKDRELLAALAIAHTLENQRQRARTLWQEVLKIDPADSEAWRSLGMIAHDGSELDEAQRALEEAVRLNPDDRIALGRLVHVFGLQGKSERGVRLAEDVLKRFPADSQMRRWLAEAYRVAGRQAEADEQRRIAKSLDRK